MPKEFEQRPGETFEAWWYRVNEVTPPDPRRGVVAS